jgi:hypothetical protein
MTFGIFRFLRLMKEKNKGILEDIEIDKPEANEKAKIRENIRTALLKLDKAQFILNDIEATYLAIQDLDPEIYPEVTSKYKRIEALLNMLLDFVYAGKSDMDEITDIMVSQQPSVKEADND